MSAPILYAHRGAAAERPENTMSAFARALELGADAIETDVHLSKDGCVVISHDPDGRRAAGVARAIAESTYAEIERWDAGATFVDARGDRPFAGEKLPTLDALLATHPGVPLNVDLKQHTPEMARAIVELIHGRGAEARVTLASFDQDTLEEVRRLGYRGRTSLAQREVIALVFSPFKPKLGGTIAQIPHRLGPLSFGTRAVIERCHARGVRVEYWTVDDPVVAQRLLALGADGIMTNDPGAIAPVFRSIR